jgi:type IV pilus assembly protein PilA
MLTPAERRLRNERGFTLIELLVVMIIIAILMAVAVPTFLKQKQSAVGTKAKANIKVVQGAIESCASGNTSGMVSSTQTGERNCTTTAALNADEPSLTSLLGSGTDQVEVTAVNTMGYTLAARFIIDGGNTATFTYSNDGAGGITRTCSPANSKAGCVGGVWK